MSNKSFVRKISTILDLIGEEFKDSRASRVLFEILGKKEWCDVKESGMEFSEDSMNKVKEAVSEHLLAMDDNNWKKHYAEFLISPSHSLVTNLLVAITKNHVLSNNDQECKDLVDAVMKSNLHFKNLRRLISRLVTFSPLVTCFFNSKEFIEVINKPENIKISEEMGLKDSERSRKAYYEKVVYLGEEFE
jgi:hypothetical protein